MIDPYLAQFISADKPAVTFDTRETVQLQDALNKIGDEEGIELWRKWTQRERQQFFFLAGRVEDLETWMRIAKKTWIAAMREEFHNNISEIEAQANADIAKQKAALDAREREITLSVHAAITLQADNAWLREENHRKDQEKAELHAKLLEQGNMIRAARRLINAINELQAAENN